MLVKANNQPNATQDLNLMVCWMGDQPLQPRGKYTLRHTTQDCRCVVREVLYKVDINTLHRVEGDLDLCMNDIGRIRLRASKPIFGDAYRRNRSTGSVILVDEQTNATVAAGMLL